MMRAGVPAPKPSAGMGRKVKRDLLLLGWLAAGLLVMLVLFAEALSTQGSARLYWAGAVFLFLVPQAILEWLLLNRLYPEHREQNADWALFLPTVGLVWLVMQQLVAGSFSGI